MADDRLTVHLDTKYDPRGLAQMRTDLLKLRQMQINATSRGGTLSRTNKAEMATLQTNISTMERKRAKAQRDVLISGLGVMFFMMSLNKIFTGFASPAADIAGIFEIFTLILQLMMLPIMLKLLPVMLELLSVVAELPEDIKLGIGAIVLLGVAVTSIVGFIAQLSLGLNSIGLAGSMATTITGAFGALATALASPIALIAALVAGMALLMVYRDEVSSFFTELSGYIANLLGIGLTDREQEFINNMQSQSRDVSGIESIPMVGQPLADAARLGYEAQDALMATPLGAPMAFGKGLGEFISAKVAVNIFNTTGIQSSANIDQIEGGAAAEDAVFLNTTGG